MDERDWARISPTDITEPPTPARSPRHAKRDDGVTGEFALRATGWVILFLTVMPPIAVILWRLATMPWPN